MKKLTLLAFIIIPLIGCQQTAKLKNEYIRNRGKDYLTSYVIAPLKIPDELSYPGTTEYFPVPDDLAPIGHLAHVSLVPPGFGVISESTEVGE